MEVGIVAAFLAGVVSFLSPCVLPLVPGYVSMLSGIGVEQLKQGQAPRGSLLLSAVAFVVGFSIVFIAFGASASAVGSFLVKHKTQLTPIAGALVILFGLHLIGWLVKIPARVSYLIGGVLLLAAVAWMFSPAEFSPWNLKPVHPLALALVGVLGPPLSRLLNRDVHMQNVGGQPGMIGGFLLGFAFAFGWTPCIGPILASVLALAATQETIGQGIFLLAVYSAGLAIPFLLTALGISGFLKFYQNFRKHLHMVEVGSGALLLFVGALIYFDRLTWLADKFSVLNDLVLWLEKKVL